MKATLPFYERLFGQINSSSYVLLNPIPLTDKSTTIDILFRNIDLNPLVKNISQFKELSSLTVATSFKSSKAVLKFKDNSEMIINFIHKFAHKSLIYMDEEEVIGGKVKENLGYYIPCVEHLFEHRVLKSFLALKGIGKESFQYFKEFHILVQEDLLDYFNIKYGTTFSSIYQLTDFDETQRSLILKKLKNIPTNGFMKKVNVQWHNFLGAMRQSRII